MSILVIGGRKPPPVFVAYSMPVLWIDLLLTGRVFEQTGVLMMLLKEMIRGIWLEFLLLAWFVHTWWSVRIAIGL